MKYNWQTKDWPEFGYEAVRIEDLLFSAAESMGRLDGTAGGLEEDRRIEAAIDLMVAEAVKSFAIEGENLNPEDVKSSIRKGLGLSIPPKKVKDQKAQGAAELMLRVRHTFSDPLSNGELFHWHVLLFGSSTELKAGAWRIHEEPMQIVSGPLGRQKVHFEAPPSKAVDTEMDRFIEWFNETAGESTSVKYGLIRAAIAHLWFESIHPFEDGNGRIGRAIAEKALSQSRGGPVLLSLSNTIEREKKSYYQALEKAQRSNEITEWLQYFIGTILSAQKDAEALLGFILNKSRFYNRFRNLLNERQAIVIGRMLEEGWEGFEGGMSARKYMAIAKTSKATATRDMQQLVELGAFRLIGGGRSSRYELVFE